MSPPWRDLFAVLHYSFPGYNFRVWHNKSQVGLGRGFGASDLGFFWCLKLYPENSALLIFMVDKKIDITSHSVDETRELGKKVGTLINHPVTIALIGDLGCGKTAFVQGIAQGLGIPADYYITSPTFTLINEYPGRLPLFHVDLYRLEGLSDFEDIGLDELLDDQAVVAIEWADRLPDAVFEASLSMTFEIIDDTSRKISIKASGQNEVVLIKALELKICAALNN